MQAGIRGGSVRVAKTIMTVDDSASVRQMVSFTLRTAGYEVVEAADGAQALERLRGPVHLILTDLNMPRMDGIELVKRVRSDATTSTPPSCF